ncbi:serine hydrolase [Fulvivirga sedimenti]|uniref:Serine hydrolase n=1 Tax=Fulvivirga sedimenti TaxID=2879465 RepID=A0A9X1HKZ0_9BACT|nr:serine hydrolase [Fulvivirga sedimenti]MCA6073806.1 serine hydrolase [Fulvivirga sedimenti]
MKKLFPLLFLTVVVIGCNTPTPQDSSIADNIDSLMNFSYENGLFNGNILVAQNDKIVYRNAFGYADFDKNEQLNPESSFYLASVSKQFTAMAIMILKERGQLSYEDKLSDYFPDFPDYANRITIRHMLTHTSGIPDYFRLGAYEPGVKNDDVYKVLIEQEELDFEPGTQYSYSNGGYVMLSMIAEKASGEPFHEFMKTNVFTPLEMNQSLVYDLSEPAVNNRAVGYNAAGELDDYDIFTTGDGGIYSNLDDLFKWDQGLRDYKLVSMETMNEAFQPYILTSGDTSNYGFGWGINQKKHFVQHSGGLSGYRTYIRRYLDTGNAFILLTNKGNSFAMQEINTALDNILAKQEFELPEIPLAIQISALIESEGIDKAVEETKNRYAQQPDRNEYDEEGINTLGYTYLRGDDIQTALKLFKLNTELRPNSGNAYDSYAEGLLVSGDTTGSIENYKVSVTMNPNNQNGIDVLESLGVDTSNLLPEIELSEEQLNEFVGSYELEADFILQILREGDQLFIHPSGQNKSELFASSESKFYSKIVDAQITFNKDASGKVVSLTLHQGGDYEAPRMSE